MMSPWQRRKRKGPGDPIGGEPSRWRWMGWIPVLAAGALPFVSCKPQLAKPKSEAETVELSAKSPFDPPEEIPVAAPQGRAQSSVHGLLVTQLSNAGFAGEASRMNATLLDGGVGPGRIVLQFNQDVGELAIASLREVEKFHQLRHQGIASGQRIELAFAEQYSPKDGPSAAVACSLLVESILTGEDLSQEFAVTGDMNADGTVQAVGGIDGKIRGATKGKCKIVAIPKENRSTLADFAVVGDMRYFIDIQVFSISTFEEALALARTEEERDAALKEGIGIFSEVQKVLGQPDGAKWIGNPHVSARLEKVLELAPNHESARFLLLKGRGQAGTQLSLRGSFLQIYRATAPIREALRSGSVPEQTGDLSESIFALRRARVHLDPRTRGCADALGDFAEKLKGFGETDRSKARSRLSSMREEINASWNRVVVEYEKIESNPEIQEELNL